jgi:hypothetical protein
MLTGAALVIDYISGPLIQFPILYLAPVALASWHSGRRWGMALACVMPVVRIGFMIRWDEPWSMTEAAVNAAIRIAVLIGFALLFDRVAAQTRILAHQVRVLRGLLPICSFCKRIRDENGEWQPFEWYISERSEAHFSHTFCPDCAREHYQDFYDRQGGGS